MEHIVSTLPTKQPKRTIIFAIRLTEAERDQIEALARRLGLPTSFMARHFILEAVAHYSFGYTKQEPLRIQSALSRSV